MIFGEYFFSSVFILRMVLQETFVVWDTIYHDECTSDTTSNYQLQNCSLVFDTNKHTFTRTANGECYIDLLINTANITPYLGKTVTFECDLVATANSNIRIFQYVNSAWSRVISEFTTDGHLTVSSTIDNSATYIRFRINGDNLGTNGTCSFKNIKIYSI